MARPDAAVGQLAQLRGRVVAGVPIAGGRRGVRIEQHVAVLGHEQEQQAVDQPQELAVILLGIEAAVGRPVLERLAQRGVGRVRQEAASERRDRLLDAAPQLIEGAGALLLGGTGPGLQPAVLTPPLRAGEGRCARPAPPLRAGEGAGG